jgi:hypothetical protein
MVRICGVSYKLSPSIVPGVSSLPINPGGVIMEAINISLSRNYSERDWSVEIDGHLYDHISTRTLDDLVDYALIAAQQNLLESEALTGSSETDSGVSTPSG